MRSSERSFQRRRWRQHNIKAEDLPTADDSGESSSSIWFPGGLSLFFPSIFPPRLVTNSLGASETMTRPGASCDISAWRRRATCPLHHLARWGFLSPSCLLSSRLKDGRKTKNKDEYSRNTFYSQLWRSKSARSVWSGSPSCDLWPQESWGCSSVLTVGWTLTFGFIQMKPKHTR